MVSLETEIAHLRETVEAQLKTVFPGLEQASAQLESITKQDVRDIRSTSKPPSVLRMLVEALCIVLGVKPKIVGGEGGKGGKGGKGGRGSSAEGKDKEKEKGTEKGDEVEKSGGRSSVSPPTTGNSSKGGHSSSKRGKGVKGGKGRSKSPRPAQRRGDMETWRLGWEGYGGVLYVRYTVCGRSE